MNSWSEGLNTILGLAKLIVAPAKFMEAKVQKDKKEFLKLTKKGLPSKFTLGTKKCKSLKSLRFTVFVIVKPPSVTWNFIVDVDQSVKNITMCRNCISYFIYTNNFIGPTVCVYIYTVILASLSLYFHAF